MVSSECTGWVYRCSPFTGATFQVHLAIADSANDQNHYEFWMAIGTLATKARVCRQRASEAVRQITGAGLLLVMDDQRAHGHKPSKYRFLMPSDLPSVYDPSPASRAPRPAAEVSSGATPNTRSGGVRGDTFRGGGVVRGDTEVSSGATPTQREPNLNPKDPEVRRLCEVFADSLARRDGSGSRPVISKAWLQAMDGLVRIDHRAPKQIEHTITWLEKGTDKTALFWRPNVRSPGSLRKHWARMKEQYGLTSSAPETFAEKVRRIRESEEQSLGV